MAIHPNGFGQVEDQAEARPAAFVDPASRVRDRARVHSGRILASIIGLEARVHNATILHSTVVCDEVTGGQVIECGLFGQVCVWDAPLLYRVVATEGARVYGSARLLGPLRLGGDMRIIAGTWHRTPRYVHLGFCFLTEGPPGWAMVDCKFASYARWFRVGERYARMVYGWQPEQLAQALAVLMEWEATEDLRGKHWGACVPACAVPLEIYSPITRVSSTIA